jgi:hypothetical protein
VHFEKFQEASNKKQTLMAGVVAVPLNTVMNLWVP